MAIVSDLPPELLDLILARLPLRDAARAGVLSVAWGRSWRHLSDLDFTSSPCDRPAAIDAVLLARSGSVRRACLEVTDGLLPGVQGWMEALSKETLLQSLDLNFNATSLPSRLMLGQVPYPVLAWPRKLKDLVLTRCILPPVPASFAGFPSLARLCVTLSSFDKGSDLEAMIAMSGKLEELRMRVILIAEGRGRHELRMESSSLRFLEIHSHGNIKWVAARLPRVALAKLVQVQRDSVANLLRGMESSVEKLEYNGYYSWIQPPKGLPTCYENLRRFRVPVDFNNASHISSTIYFLSSAPNLIQLVVQDDTMTSVEEYPYNWAIRALEICPSLRFLHISIVPLRNALDFIRLVLSKARVLETVEVDILKNGRTQEIQEEICGYDRVSPEARIHFQKVYHF